MKLKNWLNLGTLLLIFSILFPSIASASSVTNSLTELEPQFKIYAKVTDQQTGEIKIFPVEEVEEIKPFSKKIFSEDVQSVKNVRNYEVTVEIPNDNVIQPATVETVTKTTDVTARLSINYDRLNEKIRINSVSGSWTSPSTYLTISNRVVGYADGALLGGNKATKYPTSNSFSYTTGWGYVEYYHQSNISGPRAYTEAKVSMSATSSHIIELYVTL